VRNYEHAFAHEVFLRIANWLILQTRESIVRDIPDINRFLTRRNGTQPDGLQFHFCILTDRESIAVGNFTGRDAEARRLRDQLSKAPSNVLNSNGDRFAHLDNYVLFSLASTDHAPALDIVGETSYRPAPDFDAILRTVVIMIHCIRNQMAMTDKRH